MPISARLHHFSLVQIAGTLFLIFSITVFAINELIFQFPGNIYIPNGALSAGITLLLIRAGTVLQFGKKSPITYISREVLHFYFLILLISFGTTAIQYTPFPPIDKSIAAIESLFYINMDAIIEWTYAHSAIYALMYASYFILSYELTILPVIIIVTRHTDYFYEFVFLVLVSTLIGFILYYFFPTMAPASLSDSPFFTQEQRATGLKFHEIHNYIPPSTIEGGMIALPSFHVIWSWWLQYMVRVWPIAFYTLLPFNILLAISCVMLGWHYPIDIVGSVLIVLITYKIYHAGCKWKKRPRYCFIKKSPQLIKTKG